MKIDWFTVVAQILNFLVLVWLMKRFLFKPIRNAIDTREKLIATELADADLAKAEAKAERDEFQKKNKVFDHQHAEQLKKARDEVKVERERLLNEARTQADKMSAKRQELLQNELRNLNKSISLRTKQEVFAITRKALADLGTASLEELLSDVFIRRLRKLDGKEKETLSEAIMTTTEPALLRSAFDLPAKLRATIHEAINETFQAEIHLRFVTAPELISGIELTANGYKVAWNISDYLSSMEKDIDELLHKKDKPEPKMKIKPIDATPQKGAVEHGT